MKEIERITVGRPIMAEASEGLFVWPNASTAARVVRNSPAGAGSSTTWHRAATVADVRRLRYDAGGNEIILDGVCDAYGFTEFLTPEERARRNACHRFFAGSNLP